MTMQTAKQWLSSITKHMRLAKIAVSTRGKSPFYDTETNTLNEGSRTKNDAQSSFLAVNHITIDIADLISNYEDISAGTFTEGEVGRLNAKITELRDLNIKLEELLVSLESDLVKSSGPLYPASAYHSPITRKRSRSVHISPMNKQARLQQSPDIFNGGGRKTRRHKRKTARKTRGRK